MPVEDLYAGGGGLVPGFVKSDLGHMSGCRYPLIQRVLECDPEKTNVGWVSGGPPGRSEFVACSQGFTLGYSRFSLRETASRFSECSPTDWIFC